MGMLYMMLETLICQKGDMTDWTFVQTCWLSILADLSLWHLYIRVERLRWLCRADRSGWLTLVYSEAVVQGHLFTGVIG